MSTSSIYSTTSTTGSTANTTSSTSSSNNLDSGDFMTLLLTELSNQDPLDPVSNSEMVSQMATLNIVDSLESISTQMSGLTSTSQSTYAASLIGKSVVYTDGTDYITGTVTGTDILDGEISLLIDDVEVPLSLVISVTGD